MQALRKRAEGGFCKHAACTARGRQFPVHSMISHTVKRHCHIAMELKALTVASEYTRNINYYLTDFNFRNLIKL
eukprot:2082324-Amphidinium_carterae.1